MFRDIERYIRELLHLHDLQGCSKQAIRLTTANCSTTTVAANQYQLSRTIRAKDMYGY